MEEKSKSWFPSFILLALLLYMFAVGRTELSFVLGGLFVVEYLSYSDKKDDKNTERIEN